MTTATLLGKITSADTLTQPAFSQLLDELSDRYYNSPEDTVPIPDDLYDKLLDRYELKFGKRLEVGAPVSMGTQNKRTLRKAMYSLNKIKDEAALNLWKAKFPGPYVVSDKIDGISLQQHEDQLTTRGDGRVGTAIDHLSPHLPIPETVGKAFVRAEIVMPNSIFRAKYSETMVNPRNMTAGVVNCKHFDVTTARELEVLAYEYDEALGKPLLRPSEQFQILDQLGFNTPFNQLYSDVSVLQLKELLLRRKVEADYDIDGLVVTADQPYMPSIDQNPKNSIAFKVQGETAETTVVEVEWNISKHGLIKPRIKIEPVVLSQVTITWCTGFNAGFVLQYGIGPGAVLEVTRSGDVIPYIKEVKAPAPNGPQMPNIPYEWFKRKQIVKVSDRIVKSFVAPAGKSPTELSDLYLEYALLQAGGKIPADATIEKQGTESYFVWWEESEVDICTTDETQQQRIKHLTEFFHKLDAKHVGEATIEKLYSAGHQTLKSIFALTLDEVLKVEGFQAKGAQRVVDAIQGAIVNVPLARVAAASGVMGHGFGERKIQAVLNQYPALMELDLPMSDLSDLLQRAGLKTTANLFAEKLPNLKKFLMEHPEIKLRQEGVVALQEEEKEVATTAAATTRQSLSGKIVVFTGFRDRVLEDKVVALGGRVTTSVSSKTNILVVKVLGAGKAKEIKAQEQGVEVVDRVEFEAKYVLL